jgi:diguanylate cyclase (GGDEF)-like protein
MESHGARAIRLATNEPEPDRALTILVADDDPDILFLVIRLLKSEGYEVVRASDGDEALRLVGEIEPDLLLLDVSMPGADGYEVCRRIQANGRNAPPVIFLTANVHSAARVTGLDAGAVDYVTKPFEPNELRARVRAALRTKAMTDALSVEAATDALTGVLNRSRLELHTLQLVGLARQTLRPFAGVMIDLDLFKEINDTYGHGAGDAVLAEVARRLDGTKRETDLVFRYGGDEFLVLLPDTDTKAALAAAKRFHAVLTTDPVRFEPETGPPVEIAVRASLGIAAWPDSIDEANPLIAAADEALYRAKSEGRNRIELAGAERLS